MKKTIILTGLFLICSLVAENFGTAKARGDVAGAIESLIENSSKEESINQWHQVAFNEVELEVENTDVLYKNVKGTVYHPVVSQCDDTPLITADMSVIDTTKINELRWVALSRDLIDRKFTDRKGNKIVWKGKIKLGDTIWVDYDKEALWKMTHTNTKPDSVTQAKNDLRYEKLKVKYEQVRGYWIVHDVMGTQYTKRKRNGELILDKDGNKQIVKITNSIDFLQHPEYGMLDMWERNLIIAKRKMVKVKSPLLAMN